MDRVLSAAARRPAPAACRRVGAWLRLIANFGLGVSGAACDVPDGEPARHAQAAPATLVPERTRRRA